MKKFIPIAVVMLFAVAAFAGSGRFANLQRAAIMHGNPSFLSSIQNASRKISNQPNKNTADQNTESFKGGNDNIMLINSDSVGYTWDDRQTFNSMPKHCLNYGGGAGSMVTMAMTANSFTQDFPTGDEELYYAANQGSGAHFVALKSNGQAGFKNFTTSGRRFYAMATMPQDGPEVIVSDGSSFTTSSLEVYVDQSVLTGIWTKYTIPNSTAAILPAIAVSDSAGAPIIHVIYAKYMEATPALFTDPAYLFYTASRDSGKTWSKPDTISADVQAGAYAITANGGNVAIVYNWLGILSVLQSSDNGATFTNSHNSQFAAHTNFFSSYPAKTGHDTTIYNTDTVFTWGNELDAILTPDANIHIVAHPVSSVIDSVLIGGIFSGYYMKDGNYYYAADSVDAVFYFSINDTVMFQGNWTVNFESVGPAEGQPTGSIDLNTVDNVNSSITTNGNQEAWAFTSQPQIGYSMSGNNPIIYIVYASYDQNDFRPYLQSGHTFKILYSHLYGTMSKTPNVNSSWSGPAMLTDFGTDARYPSLAVDNSVDNNYILTYFQKGTPGGRTDAIAGVGAPLFTPDYASAVKGFVGPSTTLTGVHENKLTPGTFALAQNYPNPVQQATLFEYSLNTPGNVTLRVYDMLGREVATVVNGNQSTGMHSVSFNAADLPNGVYTYALTANGKTSSNTMIVAR
ncbi:MAG TPA: T9SS type A sorting domain-containing protein [Candidatus Kapabacteria bacterium]|nr:T9SS type A sorting domain-containing protein [Candidatus Kapabacteria bacterium]